jgi:putative addiction module component (TIGR02574 family)
VDVTSILAEITSLSVDERLRLVEAISDSIAAEPGEPELTGAQRQELERRIAANETSPGDVIPWEEVKAQALKTARR